MNYVEVYAYIGASPLLAKRAEIAVSTAAVQVLAEDPATPSHAARLAWAGKTLTDPFGMARKMLVAIMTNTTLQASGDAMLDSDLQFQVNSLVTAYSAIP